MKGDIVEHNTWNDTFWGVCNGTGENHLGEILMDLRDYYNPFYCLVVGSRDFNDYQLMCTVLDHLLQNKKYIVIVSGGAKGTAHNFELAIKYNTPIKIYNYLIGQYIPNPHSGI